MNGLKIPVGVSKTGSAAIVTSDDNDLQIISVALGSSDNDNAFQQDISLGDDMIFDINDSTIRAKIIRRLTKLFDEFRIMKRFKLKKETMKWYTNPDTQELNLEFKYTNLESDEDVLFRKSFSS